MTEDADKIEAALDRILDDTDHPGVIGALHLIGRVIWEFAGRSLGRLILTFVFVFLASFTPAALLILGMTVAAQTYTRGGLFILVLICLIPMSALVGFNYVAYRGLSDIVKKLKLGQMLGAEFVAYLEPSGRMRLPLSELAGKLKHFSKETRNEADAETPGIQGLFSRMVNAMVFFTVSFVLNRIAKDCVVDDEVDLEKFANAIADRADESLISYFKRILWDLTRAMICIGALLLYLVIFVVILLVSLLS